MTAPDLITSHQLPFQVGKEKWFGHSVYRIGTCHGQWGDTWDSFYILSVMNDEPGNGHLQDVFEWFEFSCKKYGKNLLVLACWNKEFYQHLLVKRGFIALDKMGDNCIKIFNRPAYKKLLKQGNHLMRAHEMTLY